MRIGLLECDHVDEPFREVAGGDYADMFTTLLGRVAPDADVARYDVCNGEFPAAPDECDTWLATGSRLSVYDDVPWVKRLAALVRDIHDASAGYIGICFGHQMLAHALGGRTEPARSGWGVGVHRMAVADVPAWMEPPAPACNLLYMHQDQVVTVPAGGVVLGSTDHCPVAMVQVGERMLGVQAHPEFSPEFEAALLEARARRIRIDKVTAARASLAEPIDADLMGSWMANFLREGA